MPADEEARAVDLQHYPLRQVRGDPPFNEITRIAAEMCGAEAAQLTVVEEDEQWILSTCGGDDEPIPRESSFCAHAIMEPDAMLIVPDATKHPEFKDNPIVSAGKVRFYAGVPLVTPGGHSIGTLCVIDSNPRTLEPWQKRSLVSLARQSVILLEFEHSLRESARIQQETRDATDALHRAEKRRTGMIRNTIHDMGTPLTVITTQAALIERTPQASETADRARKVANAAKQLKHLGEDLGRVMRTKEPRIAHETVQLTPLLKRTTQSLDAVANQKGIRLTLDAEVLSVTGDRHRILQIMSNLLSNALKFTPRGGQVDVRARLEGDEAVVQVIDTGTGFPPQKAKEIFRPFVQLHEPDPERPQGTGLGLSITKRLVEAQGGRIRAESPGAGKGATFTFMLPLAPESRQDT